MHPWKIPPRLLGKTDAYHLLLSQYPSYHKLHHVWFYFSDDFKSENLEEDFSVQVPSLFFYWIGHGHKRSHFLLFLIKDADILEEKNIKKI